MIELGRTREKWKNGLVLAYRDKKGRFKKGHRHLSEETIKKIMIGRHHTCIRTKWQFKAWQFLFNRGCSSKVMLSLIH